MVFQNEADVCERWENSKLIVCVPATKIHKLTKVLSLSCGWNGVPKGGLKNTKGCKLPTLSLTVLGSICNVFCCDSCPTSSKSRGCRQKSFSSRFILVRCLEHVVEEEAAGDSYSRGRIFTYVGRAGAADHEVEVDSSLFSWPGMSSLVIFRMLLATSFAAFFS